MIGSETALCGATLEFRLLGPFSVHLGGVPIDDTLSGPAQHLLIYLLLHPDQRHRRDWLMDQVWAEGRVSRSAFNTALWRVKRFLDTLDGAELTVSPQTLRLTLDPARALIDTRELLETARDCMAETPTAENARLDRAVRRWRGPCADGLTQDWALAARERLHASYIQALTALMRNAAQAGRFELALDFGLKILAEDPFREGIHCEVIWLFVLTGQRAQAIRSHARYRALLQDELGIAPMAETEALMDYIHTGLEAAPPSKRDSLTAGDAVSHNRTVQRYQVYIDAIDRSREQLFEVLRQEPSES